MNPVKDSEPSADYRSTRARGAITRRPFTILHSPLPIGSDPTAAVRKEIDELQT
jgi:hypothetical protein